MKPLVRKNILNIKPYQPGKPIEEVKRELGLEEIVKLASNENPLGPSPKALAAMRDALDQVNRYPDGNCFYLKERLAQNLGVGPTSLIFGNGSNEIIELVVRTFLNEGEEVIIGEPTFLVFSLAVEVEGGKVRRVPLEDFRFNLKAIREAITDKTKLIFIDNPVNPAGTYVTREEVDNFLDHLPQEVIVVFDEAYYEFVDKEDFPDTLKYFRDERTPTPNIIILRTFSKAHALSGLRIGYGISCSDFIDYMNRVRQPFNVNSLAQAAALASLEDTEHIERTSELVAKGKEFLYKSFDQMGLSYIPSATNFIFVDVKTDGVELFRKILNQGVIIRDMYAYNLPNFIRVTIGTEEENKKFVEALKKCL